MDIVNFRQIKKNKTIVELVVFNILVACLFVVICTIKGIQPFGDRLLGYSDAGVCIVPLYYHIWDFLHGDKALLFDWYTGMGNNMSGVIDHMGLLSPINLILLFIKRSDIQYFFSILILIRINVIGTTMFYYLHKNFRIQNRIWILVFSLAYAFNGYTMQYYIFPAWLDLAAIFPILISSIKNLCDKKDKCLGYIICLTCCAILSINIFIMILIFIVFFSFLYILFFVNIYERKNVIMKLGLSTLLSILLSSFIFLPAIINILDSARGSTSIVKDIFNAYRQNIIVDGNKSMMIVALGVPITCGIIYFLSNAKKSKNRVKSMIFTCYLIVILIVPLIFESSNLIWHMGSYIAYPMRFAFMLQFCAIILGAYGIEGLEIEGVGIEGTKKKIIMIGILVIILIGNFSLSRINFLWEDCNEKVIFCVILTSIGTVICFCLKKQRRNINLLALLYMVFLFVISSQLITSEENKSINSPVSDCYSLKDEMLDIKTMDRIKNLDSSIQHNYPIVLKHQALSNIIHIVSQEQINLNKNLGYAQVGTRMSDTGGTNISDAILGYTTAFSKTNAENSIYKRKNSNPNDFMTYDIINSIPLGITINKEATYNQLNGRNAIYNQDIFAKTLLNKSFFEVFDIDSSKDIYSYNIKDRCIIYFYAISDKPLKLKVNGKEISIPTLDKNENYLYPELYNSGIIDLGEFSNEKISLQILNENNAIYQGSVAICNVDNLKKLTTEDFMNTQYKIKKCGMSIKINNQKEEDYLYLPIYADKGWTGTNNGNKIRISRLFDTLMLIPLEKGENEIEISYSPRGFKIGIVITNFAILLIGCFYFNIFKILDIKILKNVLVFSFCGIYFILFMLLVGMPVILEFLI